MANPKHIRPWQQVAEQTAKEDDCHKLQQLSEELEEALADCAKRLRRKNPLATGMWQKRGSEKGE